MADVAYCTDSSMSHHCVKFARGDVSSLRREYAVNEKVRFRHRTACQPILEVRDTARQLGLRGPVVSSFGDVFDEGFGPRKGELREPFFGIDFGVANGISGDLFG